MEVVAEVVEWLGFLPSLSPGFTSRCISCLSSRSTSTPVVLLAKLLVDISSCLLLCLWSSRAKVSWGAKLDFQHSAHLAIHSLQGEAGISACSPDPVEGGEKLVKFTSVGMKHNLHLIGRSLG